MDDIYFRRIVRYCKCIAGTANESDEALVQIRMDVSVKEAVEKLYKDLGISFEDAVRVFAIQSIHKKGYPFISKKGKDNT